MKYKLETSDKRSLFHLWIRMIQDKAETYAYLSIVDTISYAESLLLGDPFDFLSNVPVLSEVMRIPSLSCCRQIYRSKLARRVIHRWFLLLMMLRIFVDCLWSMKIFEVFILYKLSICTEISRMNWKENFQFNHLVISFLWHQLQII